MSFQAADLLYFTVYLGVGAIVVWFLPNLAQRLLQRRGIEIQPRYWITTKIGLLFLTILAMNYTFFLFPSWVDRALSLIFWFLLIVLSLTDLWSFYLLDMGTIGGILLLLPLRIIHPEPILSYLITAVVAGVGLFLFAYLTKGMGLGDAKLLALCGFVLGFPKVLIAFWIATGIGLIVALRYIREGKKKLPFGPFIAVGSYLAWLWGDKIWKWIM